MRAVFPCRLAYCRVSWLIFPREEGVNPVLCSVEFKIDAVGEDRSFVTEEGALSDHPALFIELSI